MSGPLQAVYYATKAYVTFFSKAVAEELHDTNITVTALLPGATDTDFARVSDMDRTSLFKKTVPPREVALKEYEGMMKGKLDVIAGITFIQKIMLALLPFLSKRTILKKNRISQEI